MDITPTVHIILVDCYVMRCVQHVYGRIRTIDTLVLKMRIRWNQKKRKVNVHAMRGTLRMQEIDFNVILPV